MSKYSREKRAAFAAMTQQRHDARQAQYNAERDAAATAQPEDQEKRLSDLFREAFVPSVEPTRYDRPVHQMESVWDSALRLADDDDAPAPPAPPLESPPPAAPAPIAAEPPVEETRTRVLSADELFAELSRQMATTPETVPLSGDVAVRQAFRELPGPQRIALERLVEAQDYMEGYFAHRSTPDHTMVLVGSALARRYRDAVKLQPEVTPQALLSMLLEQAAS